MKIGFFLPNATFDLPGSPEVGGIETFSFLVGEALQNMGHTVVLFGGNPKPGRRHMETKVSLRLFDYIETGETLEEFLENFPSVTKRQAIDVLEMARTTLTAEKILDENFA